MERLNENGLRAELNLLLDVIKKYNSFAAFNSSSLIIPIEEFNDLSKKLSEAFSEVLLPKNYLTTLERTWKKIFAQKYTLMQSIHSQGIQKAVQEMLHNIEARLFTLLTFVFQERFNYVVKKFRYRGYTVLVIHHSHEIACIQHEERKPFIVLREDVPQEFYEPILEHEIAELESTSKFHNNLKMAHELAGVPAGRKKAQELGILEAFLAFEREHQIS